VADLVIRGGMVYDGTGAPPRRADVSVSGGMIETVGEIGAHSGRSVDASGLAVAPGFFDFHSHADFTIPGYPNPVNSISQGVTTELMGNCGFSPAPLSEDAAKAAAYATSCAGIGPYLEWDWSTFGEYLAKLDSVRPAVNCAPLVGHNAIRSAVMGYVDRPATQAELAAMEGLVVDAMEAGAWGLSSGLVYAPGTYAAIDELAALARPVASAGGIYTSHVRNEGEGLIGAVEEALEVGRRTGATVQVSHLKVSGADNYGLVRDALGAIDSARHEGMQAFCDVYPYTAGSTFLAMLTPGWAQEGGFDELVSRLRSPAIRDRVKHEMLNGLPGWNSFYRAAGGWERIFVSGVGDRSLARYEGLSIADLSSAMLKDPFEFTFDLLVDDRAATLMVAFLMDEADVHEVLRFPWSVIGSDQLLVTGRDRKTHPRAYGSYTKVLGPLVRDSALFSLETAVHKMSGLPASILGMSERGRIASGTVADIVLFDPDKVADAADYAAPTELSRGIELVLMAGETAYEAGAAAKPGLGRVLRRSG
jgi:N-acyl-D-aspartate/D-glutamate deacylase